MHQSVIDRFVDFTKPLEGEVLWMYLDILGLVSTGIGNLIDPVSSAIGLPWRLPDGELAPKELVAAQWHDLKAQQNLKRLHYNYAASVTTVRLTEVAVAALVRARLLANEVDLKRAFPHWDEWPADAQLCACSMAWAVGSGFPRIFGNFTRLANRGDWANALQCCAIKTEGNPGIVPRNAQNKLCLTNAAAVVAQGLDAGQLYWPDVARPADDTLVHADARAAMADWDVQLNALTNVLCSGLNLQRGPGDYETYDGDGKPHDTEPALAPTSEVPTT